MRRRNNRATRLMRRGGEHAGHAGPSQLVSDSLSGRFPHYEPEKPQHPFVNQTSPTPTWEYGGFNSTALVHVV